MNIGTPEIIVIMILALILYGKRLPEIMRAVGKGYAEFMKSLNNIQDDLKKSVEDMEAKVKEADKIYSENSTESPARNDDQSGGPAPDKTVTPFKSDETKDTNDNNLAG